MVRCEAVLRPPKTLYPARYDSQGEGLGFFFGATQREYDLAAKLGDKFRFAFVVLNSANAFGKPFAVLLTLSELEYRTRAKRIQYQVNLWNARDAQGSTYSFLIH